ncbi:hypothetical protein HY417_04360 [Candidatus Kaiserbacteria bacterium]|nr:hypothetical protein [Candidatus Kaiserbacteria bacterium]
MSELSFKGLLEGVKGRELTDKQCAKVLKEALQAYIATARSARETLAEAEGDIEFDVAMLERLNELDGERSLSQREREMVQEITADLEEARRHASHIKNEFVDHAERRVAKIARLIEQLVESINRKRG